MNTSTVRVLLVLAILLSFSCTIHAQLIDKKTVSLALAKKIAAAGEDEAAKNKLNAVIAVVDDGGNLVYLERMDGAQIGSIEIALQKAKTAIYFRRATKTYEDRVAGGTNALLSLPNVLPFEGGLPLMADGLFVGAVGVSGGNPQQDGIVAKAAVEALTAK
jgi:glc operon protein GlcG